MSHLSSDLEKYLRKDGATDKEIALYVELPLETFKMMMEDRIEDMMSSINQVIANYNDVMQIERNGLDNVRYYTDGMNIYYVAFTKPKLGYKLPNPEVEQ